MSNEIIEQKWTSAERPYKDPDYPLSTRYLLFCKQLFLTGFNQTQAAINAGFSNKGATQTGSKLLTFANVQREIELMKRDLGRRVDVSREDIARELKRLAFFDAGKLLNEDGSVKNLSDIDEDTRRAIGGIDIETTIIDNDFVNQEIRVKKIKLSEKRAALAELNKMMGYNEPEKFIIDHQNVSNQPQINLNIQVLTVAKEVPIATHEEDEAEIISITNDNEHTNNDTE